MTREKPTTPLAATEHDNDVMTATELAEMLRFNPKTVYEALARGEIPGSVRIGGSYRISRSSVIQWLAEGQGRVLRRRKR